MRYLRRLLQVIAIVGTLLVGIVAVSLIVSQTPWFKDWLRRYIVRESKQYLNGELTIGKLGGNLFFGVNLDDVAVDVSGQRVVAVKGLVVDYSIFDFISKGIVLDEIKLNQPMIRLERDANGWNVARLVKRQRKEADREGPGRPVSMASIEIADGNLSVRDVVGTSGVNIPEQIADLDLKGSFEYAPVHYTFVLEHASFKGAAPQIAISQATGKISVRDDNLYLDQVAISTAESALRVSGVIEDYLATPVIKVTSSGNVSLPELGRVVPAVAPYRLHPTFEVKANGPANRLAMDLNVRSDAGNVRGQLTADLQGPNLGAEGEVDVERLNLAPILRDPAQRSNITGHAKVDVELAGRPANAPAIERLRGTFAFTGPHVVAAGYEARDVRVTGRIAGRRIEIDGRGNAYGGSATAKGFILTPAGRSADVAYDLRGSASGVNLRNLPARIGAPRVTTSLSLAQYHVKGSGRSASGTATLNQSTVEGATISTGTVASFQVTPGTISYTARGTVADLDLERVGRAFDVAAIAKPEYASRLNGAFDVKGSMPRTPAGRRERESSIATMTVDATGMLKNSEIMGGTLPEMGFEAHLANGTLSGKANGRFEHFDPARLLSRPEAKGDVTGTVNADFTIANLEAPVTPESVTATGQLTLATSTVGGLKIDSAAVDGTYANQVGDIKTFTLAGPDVKADASGRVALDTTSQSNLKYHIEAINLPELAKLAGQTEVGGSAILVGTITGNRAALTATGTLDGSNLSYQKNTALDLDSQYTVTVPNLTFANAKVDATTTGTFIRAGAFEISALTAKTTYENQRMSFTTNIKEKTRELDATGELILHTDHQEFHLPSLALRTQGVEWKTAPGSEATIKYGQERIELQDVRLVSTDQSLDVSGTIALKGDAPSAALDVKARNVDIQQLETLLLQNRGFTGKLTADAKVTGTAENPTIAGHVEVRNGTFQTYKYESLIGDINYTGRRAQIDATLTQSPTEKITAKGSVPLSLFTKGTGGHTPPAAGEEVDLHITSTAINLGLIQGFTDLVTNVTGTLQADVRVTGSGDDPHLKGFIDIRNGSFGVPMAGGTYTGLDTRIELTEDVVKLQEFRILDAHQNWLRVSGQLAVHEKQVGAVDITLTSDNFEVVDNELGDVGVDASVKITGELRRPRVEGDVKLEAARLEVDRLMQLFYDPYATEALPEVVSAERTVEGSGSAEEATKAALRRAETSAAPPGAEKADLTPPAPRGIFDAVSMQVRLIIPDNLVLRGKDLRPSGPTGSALGDMNITVGGDVQVRKNPGGVVTLLGNVVPVRGTYEFQGRRFELVRGGFVRFIGESEINPMLDISATRQIPNTGVEARVRVTGTLKQPELQLTSNPPLEESDILALIVFNRPVNELGTGERSSLAATAGGIATGFIAAPLGDSIGRALDLDLFEITTTTETGDLGAGVTLGQQVGDRAFVKLRQQFGERNVTEFMLEYNLTRFLRLEVTGAPESSASANRINQRRIERGGIDLIFFFSY
jgi:autotransporter translocation and assembly factor TamB